MQNPPTAQSGNSHPSPEELAKVLTTAKNEWETTFDALPDAVLLLDLEGRIGRANKAAADNLGLPIRELVGKRYCELFGSPHGDGEECCVEGLLAAKETSAREVFEPRLGGWVLISGSPMIDKAGGRTGTVLVARDINAGKQAEDSLRGSEERFRALVETIPDGIMIVDEGRIAFANHRLAELTGFPLDELAGMSPEALVDPADLERYRSVLHDFGTDDVSPWRFDVRLRAKDGGVRVVWNRMRRMPAPGGGRAPLLMVLADITREYQAREQLRRTQANLVNSQRLARLGSWTHELPEDRIEWSSEMYRLLDLPRRTTPSEALLFAAMAPEDVARIRDLRASTPAGPEGFSTEVQLLRTGGDAITICMYHETTEAGADGAPAARNGVLQDVTDLRDLERQLAMASRLDSVGTLAGGIGHDFNNFLTGVTAGASLAKVDARRGDLAGVMEELTRIEEAAMQARNLARQLLVFSKGSEPVRAVVDVRGVVEEAVALACRGTSVRFTINDDAAGVRVYGDRGQLYQVCFNLALNAREATAGTTMPRLAVTLEHRRPGASELLKGEHLRVVFADNGEGIQEDVVSRVFDPFFSTKGSSGLGLSVCQRIVRNHSGHIALDSKRGVGTRVIVDLPVATETQVEKEGSGTDSSFHGTGEVLVMDDETFILDTYARLLRHFGFHAVKVSNGEQAVEAYRSALATGARFRAVLLDLTVRGGKGGDYAAAEILKLDPQACVMLASGYSENPILARHAEHGIRGVLTKPFGLAQLREALSKALR
ncbi:MAG: PAS domain S-box protein [Candidatus Sumerlaeia bacterium]|nr:PAS domain S-box protein [Candidatus Sumerlaeia bacterium]